MGFNLGFNKSKSKDTGTRDATSTTTTTAPDWLMDLLKTNTDKATTLASADPSSYVAGPNPYQTAAVKTVGGLTGSPENFKASADAIRGLMGEGAKTGADFMSRYESPYKKDVVDAAMADFDASAGKTRAAQKLDIAGQGAFGGSGAALTRSATEGELARARNTGLSSLLDNMFNRSAGYGMQDADRSLQGQAQQLAAARALADVSTGFDANQRANAGTAFDMGTTLQGIDQTQAQAPLALQAWLNENGLSPLLQALFGKTTNENEKTTGTGKTSGFNAGLKFDTGDVGKVMQAMAGG